MVLLHVFPSNMFLTCKTKMRKNKKLTKFDRLEAFTCQKNQLIDSDNDYVINASIMLSAHLKD